MRRATNDEIAGRLDEVATLLAQQGAKPFQASAYRRAATTLRQLPQSVAEIHDAGGVEDLESLPSIGPAIARAIATILVTGRLPMLDRLRGDSDPVALFLTVPGIGPTLANRLHNDLGLDTLEELEAAAHDGRLETIVGVGPKRLSGIRDSLAHRLARVRRPVPPTPRDVPPIAEILDVDREYRKKAKSGSLETIRPRRFNPERQRWLPILHTRRGDRHYTALFSNTARAHELGKTDDWVVMYYDNGHRERQCTVITAGRGPFKGRRVVPGRELDVARFYGDQDDLDERDIDA